MASSLKNLSAYKTSKVPSAKAFRFGIVVAEWNEEITSALLEGALNTLKKHGATEENIVVHTVPGTFELSFGAKALLEHQDLNAVVVLGCVIQGDTRHFDFICQGVTHGITELNIRYETPVVFGVLTTNTLQQAKDRAGGKHGNKGDEAAYTAIRMAHFASELSDLDDLEPNEDDLFQYNDQLVNLDDYLSEHDDL